jgi:hypothetical protein
MRILVSIMLAWQVLLTGLYFHQRYEFTQFAEYVGATADPHTLAELAAYHWQLEEMRRQWAEEQAKRGQ